MRATACCLAAFVVAACGDRVPLSDAPVTIGPASQLLAARSPLPTHGPRSELTIWLPAGYHKEDSAGHGILYDANRQRITFHAALTFADSTLRPLRFNGFILGKDKFAVQFNEEVPTSPGATARGVMISANVPVYALRVDWWSGDPRSRCFLCL